VSGPRNRTIDLLQYVALRMVVVLLEVVSIETAYRAGRWVGDVMWRVLPRQRRRAQRHLQLSFPDWPPERVDRVARRSFRNLIYLGLEVALTPRLITLDRWRQHIRVDGLAEALGFATRRREGLILVAGHFGSWEIAGYTIATLGFPAVAVARPLDNPYINDYLMGVRERTGQSILYKKGAAAGMADVLRRGDMLAFIADQDAGKKGVFVDFFGRLASTYRSVALVAHKTETPIVVGFGRRLSERFEFQIGVQRMIRPAEWAGKEDPITWITREYTRALEEVIRTAPEQYLWTYRRWRHRPDGTVAGDDGVA